MNLPDSLRFHAGQHKGCHFRRGDGDQIRTVHSAGLVITYGLRDYWYGYNRMVDAKYLRDNVSDWHPTDPNHRL